MFCIGMGLHTSTELKLLEICNKTLTIFRRKISFCTLNTDFAAPFALLLQLLPWIALFRAVVNRYL